MSLTEVLGVTFSNLQLAQQSSSLAQPNVNSSHPNVPPSYATNAIPQLNALPLQTPISVPPQTQPHVPSSGSNHLQFSQAPACILAEQPAIQSSGKTSHAGGQNHINGNLPSAANGAGVSYQVCFLLNCDILHVCKQYINSERSETQLLTVFLFRKCSHSLCRRRHQKASWGKAGG